MKSCKVRFYVGLDVHKNFTEYVIRNVDGAVVLEGRCASIGKDLESVLDPYLFSCVIGLETNTEIYPVYEHFKERGRDIRAGNTVQMRSLIGKNDNLDARRLADMLRLNTFPCAYIPEGKIKELRGLVKLRHNTLEEVHRIQSQIQALTRKYGLTLPSGESFTKKWCNALESHMLLSNGLIELKSSYEIYQFLDSKLEQLTERTGIFAKTHFPKEHHAIISIRGIGSTLAPYLISEICPISRFKSVKKLRRYAGVIPVSNETGGKVKSTFIPKCSSRTLLRYALVMAAGCASRHDENIKEYFRKKKKQKKIHNTAIMAVASSMSDKVYKALAAC